MNNCPNCGLIRGLHASILPGCMCAQTPQRTWVGLTHSEQIDCRRHDPMETARVVEAKLKEKIMSEALERVIAEQQKVIDQLKNYVAESDAAWQKTFRQREELKDAVFLAMNTPSNAMYKRALLDTMRNQGWCLQCEQMPCECDD